ncbi:NfeD family protein, partial [Glaesserella parasuis]|nr:NfeD family protein [Glaesserella parasuis]
MEWLSGWTAWLIFGFILLILETLIAGIFIMWWGFAAIIVAIYALLPSKVCRGWICSVNIVLDCVAWLR